MPKPFVTYAIDLDTTIAGATPEENTTLKGTYLFLAPENHYNGAVDVGVTGVRAATDTEIAILPIIPVANLLKSNVATRRTLTVRVGTTSRSVKFVIASNKAGAFDGLKSGNYTMFKGQAATIKSASEPLKATFG